MSNIRPLASPRIDRETRQGLEHSGNAQASGHRRVCRSGLASSDAHARAP